MLLFKIREMRSPFGEVHRGWRMALAVPNESGFRGSPSFIGKFLVAESSDFTDRPELLQALTWIQEHARGESVTFLE